MRVEEFSCTQFLTAEGLVSGTTVHTCKMNDAGREKIWHRWGDIDHVSHTVPILQNRENFFNTIIQY